MSAPAPPTIPPRPVKQQAAAQGVTHLPEVPPRPTSKQPGRSVSPTHYPDSPLNEPHSLHKTRTQDLPARPPSVSRMPIAGEEGIEYANIQYRPQNPSSGLAQDADAQTRTVAEDLQLHAPKPSLPKASATAQVQGVTRTDVGRSSVDDLSMTRTRSRQSFSRPDSAASGDRRRSIAPDEQGPAEIGLRVPINPLLGDVQAPTPQDLSPQVTGEGQRRHSRKQSDRQDFRPPDSYGLHGHGVIANNRFEREWYEKHPDQLEHEEGQGHGVYEGIGSGRGSYALSSEELNKIVRNTAARPAGLGTQKNIPSYPDEQIGYMASEVYQRSQGNTPQPDSLSRIQTRASQPDVASPLRRTSFAAEDAPSPEIRRSRLSTSHGSDHSATDDHDDTHHIEEPKRKFNKITGGQESQNETQDAKPYLSRKDSSGNEHSIPILAEDQASRDDGSDRMQPAVAPQSPKVERKTSQQYDEHDRSGALTPNSRPSSRPGSIYQMHSASHSLSRFLSHQDEREHMHTPLEDVAEYEPLFEEDEEKRKSLSHAERFKSRPDLLQKRFPSQDIWEDAPSSTYYSAEVSTPDLPSQVDSTQSETQPASVFETPEAEHARKGEVSEQEREKLIPKEERLAKSQFAPYLREDMPTQSRPSILANRFPSQDVWEDSSDYSQLVTTVSTPQPEEESSPVEQKPPVPARPAKSRLGEEASSAQIEPSVPPSVPARPPRRMHQVPPADAKLTEPMPLSNEPSPTELKKTPSIPDRPKPQIPPRPARKAGDNDLTKVTSAGSTDSTETEKAIKPKPQVPARPAGGIVASLKGNFMSDLNKKLGLGPPKEKEKEPEPDADVKPLEDARKGRARGPQRRAPAKSPAAEPKSTASLSMFAPRSIWQINEEDELSTTGEAKRNETTQSTLPATEHVDEAGSPDIVESKAETNVNDPPADAPAPVASGLAANTAGEPVDPISTGSNEERAEEMRSNSIPGTFPSEPADQADHTVQPTMPSGEQTQPLDRDAVKGLPEGNTIQDFESKAEDEPIKAQTIPQ